MRITSLVLVSLLCPSAYASWGHQYYIDTPRKQHANQTHPYLAVIGPPPLRFASAKPPPDLLVRPPAAGPPNITTVDKDAPPPLLQPDQPIEEIPVEHEHTPPPAITQEFKVISEKKTPSAIIPDDIPSRTKHEDFLPFFQFPGQSGNVTIAIPAPDQPAPPPRLPRSSATYQQR